MYSCIKVIWMWSVVRRPLFIAYGLLSMVLELCSVVFCSVFRRLKSVLNCPFICHLLSTGIRIYRWIKYLHPITKPYCQSIWEARRKKWFCCQFYTFNEKCTLSIDNMKGHILITIDFEHKLFTQGTVFMCELYFYCDKAGLWKNILVSSRNLFIV